MGHRECGYTVASVIKKLGTYAVFSYSHSFDDLISHWSRKDIEVLIAHHMVDGVTEKQFEPDCSMTSRIGQIMVELLDSASGGNRTERTGQQPAFSDVSPDQWYFPYVQAAADNGLIQGSDGKFRPNDPVTREEMAVMIVSLLGLNRREDAAQKLPFQDDSLISDWAVDSVKQVYRLGVMNGISETLFSPHTSATRAAAAAVLYRLMERLGLITETATVKGLIRISDVEGCHYELTADQMTYVLLPDSEGLAARLEQLAGQTAEATGLKESGPSSVMRGSELRVYWINEKSMLALSGN